LQLIQSLLGGWTRSLGVQRGKEQDGGREQNHFHGVVMEEVVNKMERDP
jgi:hypothetical protein